MATPTPAARAALDVLDLLRVQIEIAGKRDRLATVRHNHLLQLQALALRTQRQTRALAFACLVLAALQLWRSTFNPFDR